MNRNTLLMIVLIAASSFVNAQERGIARGAVEGELYMSTIWYVNYYESDYLALLHITENGKKVEINHSMEYDPPNTLIGDALPMYPNLIMADVTPGVVYNSDWYLAYADDDQVYDYVRLWFSDDYGKTWELRDAPDMGYPTSYAVANVEGIVYRGGGGVVYKSVNYGQNFYKEEKIKYTGKEPGLEEKEVFYVAAEYYKGVLTHAYDYFETYTQIPIDSPFVYGLRTDVFRGSLPGEVYITSNFPDHVFKVSFSADTGYHFRVVHQREGYATFMSDRKAGDFYIITQQMVETQQPWGYYLRMCINHYTDYGETLVGTYCHDLTREGVVTAVDEMDEESGIVVYPNPTTGELKIENGELKIKNIEIFDLMGKSVATVETRLLRQAQQPLASPHLDISGLPAGMYFVRITTENGVITRKVVKR